MLGYAEIIAIIGFSAVILQASIVAFAPVSYALLSPVHTCCCLLLLGSLHPFLQRALRRRAEYGGRAVTAEQLMSDPVIQAALNGPKLPAPFEHSLYALALMALADVCEGLRVVYDGRAFAVAIYDGAHELLAGSAAFTLFYGTRRLGAKPSTTLSMACFASGALAAFQLQQLMPPPPLSLRGPESALSDPTAAAFAANLGSSGGSWMALAHTAAVAIRTFGCSALAAQALSAACGAVFPGNGYHARDLPREQQDLLRWAIQALGALLLLVPPFLRSYLHSPYGGGALAFGAERLGTAALTLSSWYALFPAEAYLETTADARAAGYPSVQAMKDARRAAREARRRAEEKLPPPLMLESPSRRGGVQGLDWHDRMLCRDRDGDEAHDFWEAIGCGGFRRLASY